MKGFIEIEMQNSKSAAVLQTCLGWKEWNGTGLHALHGASQRVRVGVY